MDVKTHVVSTTRCSVQSCSVDVFSSPSQLSFLEISTLLDPYVGVCTHGNGIEIVCRVPDVRSLSRVESTDRQESQDFSTGPTHVESAALPFRFALSSVAIFSITDLHERRSDISRSNNVIE